MNVEWLVISENVNCERYKFFIEKNSWIANFENIDSVMGKFFPDVYCFSIFNKDFHKHFVKKNSIHSLKGTVGCFLSHLKAIEKISRSGAMGGVVCEDDAVFIDDVNPSIFYSNYELIYLNRRMKFDGDALPDSSGIVTLNANNINGVGGEGYYISRGAAQKVIGFFQKIGFNNLPSGFDGFLQSLCFKEGEVSSKPGKKVLTSWASLHSMGLSVGCLNSPVVLHDDGGVSLIRLRGGRNG